MVSVSEATSIILSRLFKTGKEKVSLLSSTGRILAESVIADRDFPPFDRATMDGIAIRSTEFLRGVRSFRIRGVQAAGQPAMKLTDPQSCLEIMTGAMLPEEADTVIRYEDIDIREGIAHIKIGKIAKGENLHVKASDATHGGVLLKPGCVITPAELALMASIGKTTVNVSIPPRTALISTGDELVAIEQTPLPHQIRQSNVFALQAALRELNCNATQFHLPDQKQVLENELRAIFNDHDLIILSGGVSKGKFDFVPEVLESLGVKKLFHQVSQKPGKPFWFGADQEHTVFALPGNPVSTYMCYWRYIKPWLIKSLGADFSFAEAILASDFSFQPALTYFLQVKIRLEQGKLIAQPDPGGGSGDFANLKDVDGFLELPADRSEFKAGEVFPYIPFRNYHS